MTNKLHKKISYFKLKPDSCFKLEASKILTTLKQQRKLNFKILHNLWLNYLIINYKLCTYFSVIKENLEECV